MFNNSAIPSLSDIAAVTGNNDSFGGNNGWWVLIILFALFGGWGNQGSGFGGGNNNGVSDGYVLASDMARVQNTISSGLCDGFYAQNTNMLNGFAGVQSTLYQGFSGINTGLVQQGYETRLGMNDLSTQLADCCCKTQSGIERTNTNIAMTTGDIKAAIKDCCCDQERIAMQNRYESAQMNCNTLQAIDKLGDRIIDYMANEKSQALRDENAALRLQASQAMQNELLLAKLRPQPVPAYTVQNPWINNGFQCGCSCA